MVHKVNGNYKLNKIGKKNSKQKSDKKVQKTSSGNELSKVGGKIVTRTAKQESI